MMPVGLEAEAISPTKFLCRRCGNLLNNEVAYCTKCGKIHTAFATTINAHKQCPVHSQPMVNMCSLCNRPVCKSCYEDELPKDGPYKCAQCLAKCTELEVRYRDQLEKNGKCARHPKRTRIGKCKECGFPVCEFCGYLWMEGRLFRKITDGLYCANCSKSLIRANNRDKKKGSRSILLHNAVNKGFKIPSTVFDEIYNYATYSPDDGISGVTVSDCPLCGKVVRDNGPVCLHCGEELLWLGGIPYKKTRYPSGLDRLPGSASKIAECPLCGDMVRSDWGECPRCGEQLFETV